MDIGSILLLVALIVVVGAYIASPLRVRHGRKALSQVDIELSQLLAERERILDALAELDFDNEMEKVPDELYPVQREALLKRGAAVLRLLDERVGGNGSDEVSDPDHAERLERAARIRAMDDDPLEALIAARRAKQGPISATPAADSKQTAKFCSNCGDAIQPGDQFCPSCGQKLS
jgi:hypothetical protein